jgi:hypothetical protein
VAVQAFGAMGAFLENGEEGPLVYAVRLYIHAALENRQPLTGVAATLSQLSQYSMRRCREWHHQQRYDTLKRLVNRCVEDRAALSDDRGISNSLPS